MTHTLNYDSKSKTVKLFKTSKNLVQPHGRSLVTPDSNQIVLTGGAVARLIYTSDIPEQQLNHKQYQLSRRGVRPSVCGR